MKTKGTGMVKLCHYKGFGFIVDDETGKDIFFHIRNTLTEVAKDDEVSYDIGENEKGMIAYNVKKI